MPFLFLTGEDLENKSAKESVHNQGVGKLEQLRAMEHGYRIHVGITDQPTIGIDPAEDIAAFEAGLLK